jgi:hypothetical protein
VFKKEYMRIFLIGTVGGGVQWSPLGTAATNRSIVPAPDDYDDIEIGAMIGRGNRSTRRRSVPVPLCPPQTLHACPGTNPGLRGGKPATNRLSYGTAGYENMDVVRVAQRLGPVTCPCGHNSGP